MQTSGHLTEELPIFRKIGGVVLEFESRVATEQVIEFQVGEFLMIVDYFQVSVDFHVSSNFH